MTAKLKTRKPTGAVPWPLVLVEGGEKSGKSWACAEFTADPRVGTTYWLDLGEGAADEYAAIPGAEYLVLEHDGTWRDIIGQVEAVRAEASRVNAAGEKPVVLVVDSMYAEWELLKDWVQDRARRSKTGRATLQRDPDAEVKPAVNLWNDANARHQRLMRLLMQFPGIVVVTARGKETAKMGDDGKPILGERDYKVEAHKSLAFDASAWVRLSRDNAPQIVGARSVAHGLRPGVDKPKRAPSFSLAWLVFDVLKCDPNTATVRDLAPLDTAEIDVDLLLEAIRDAADEAALQGIYTQNVNLCGDRAGEVKSATNKRLAELRNAPAEHNTTDDRTQTVTEIQQQHGDLPAAA